MPATRVWLIKCNKVGKTVTKKNYWKILIIDLLFPDIYDTYVMDLQSSDYEPILHNTIYQTGDPYISKLDKTDLIFHTKRKCITCKVTQHPQTA